MAQFLLFVHHQQELMGIRMAEFRINIECVWSEKSGFKDLVPQVKEITESKRKRKQGVVENKKKRAKLQKMETEDEDEPTKEQDAEEEHLEVN